MNEELPNNSAANPESEGLEKALRASLRREAAPLDFAAKILAQAGATLHSPKLSVVKLSDVKQARKSWLQRPFTLALAAALAAAAIIPTVVVEHEHREQARGLKAKRDLLTALAITRNQLQQAREKVRTTRIIQ